MKVKESLFLSILFVGKSAFADSCDFLIAQFNQRPIAVIDPLPTGNNTQEAIETRKKALALFSEGHNQCLSGQPAEGAEKIQQAIGLLQN